MCEWAEGRRAGRARGDLVAVGVAGPWESGRDTSCKPWRWATRGLQRRVHWASRGSGRLENKGSVRSLKKSTYIIRGDENEKERSEGRTRRRRRKRRRSATGAAD